MINDDSLADIISKHIGESIDTKELEKAMDQAYKDIRQAKGRQRKLELEQDRLDTSSRHYERMFESINRRLEDTFDELDEAENRLADVEARLESVNRQALTKDSIITVLKLFDKMYDKMNDKMNEYDKKQFMQSFIESIELYPKDGRKKGTTVKKIFFKFPVSYNGETVYEISPLKEHTVETVVKLSRK